MPFCQAVVETGGFSSPRWVQSNNPAGLGATDDGAWGHSFASPAEGIIAQYGHLLAYALPKDGGSYIQRHITLLSPRVAVLERLGWRGIAPTWAQLAGRWATDKDYWVKIQRVAREINPAFQA